MIAVFHRVEYAPTDMYINITQVQENNFLNYNYDWNESLPDFLASNCLLGGY